MCAIQKVGAQMTKNSQPLSSTSALFPQVLALKQLARPRFARSPSAENLTGQGFNSTLAITALSVANCLRDCCRFLRGCARSPEAGPLAAGKYPQVMGER